MIKQKRILILLVLFFFTCNVIALNMNGDIETEAELWKDSGIAWDMNFKIPGFWISFWANPYRNLDFSFLITNKMEVKENGNTTFWYLYPKLFFAPKEIKYHYDGNGNGFELRIKTLDQDAWLGEPLFGLFNEWNVYGGRDKITYRLDGWGYYGFDTKMVLIQSMYNSNDLTKIFRLNRGFFNKFFIGMTIFHQRWWDGDRDYKLRQKYDLLWKITDKLDWTTAVAFDESPDNNFNMSTLLKTGLRGINIYSPTIGNFGSNIYFTYIPEGHRTGVDYDNIHASEMICFLEEWYNLPTKAITLKHNINYNKKLNSSSSNMNNYFEIWMEFIRGFKFKNSYNIYTDLRNMNTYPTFLWQLEIGNEFIWTKVQFRIKDFGYSFQKRLYGIESSINLTDKLKSFTRFMFADEGTRLRTSIYAQLRYDLGPSTELYLEYGDGEDGNNDGINDGDFADQDRTTLNRIKFRYKVFF